MNGLAHKVVGASVGTGVALYRAQGRATQPAVEALGGGIAGWYFGRAPDVLEPATSPNHRGPFHSLAFALLLVVGDVQLAKYQERLRGWANDHERTAGAAQTSWSRVWHEVLAFLGRLGAGALSAICPAYWSHLGLDSTTPRGLPLFA